MERPMDSLTGLISGVELNADMDALITKGGEFSYIVLDIDALFAINRDYGHDAGDAVFRLIAKHIGDIFTKPGTAYRDTRDQFDILVPDCSKEQAFLMAEQLRDRVFKEKTGFASPDGKMMAQSISVGVSSFPEDGSRTADILRRADSAMMRAKKNGRNLVCLAREEKLIPKTSHYTQAQLEKLSFLSGKLDVGEAALLREALDVLLKMYDADGVYRQAEA